MATKTDHEALVGAIGPHAGKPASAEDLAVGRKHDRRLEIELYPDIVRLAHDLIARAFARSHYVGKPQPKGLNGGFVRRRSIELGVVFPPFYFQTINAANQPVQAGSTSGLGNVIQPGDLLHIDFASPLKLNTHTQQHAYLLREEKLSFQLNFKSPLVGNRLKDILMSEFELSARGMKFC